MNSGEARRIRPKMLIEALDIKLPIIGFLSQLRQVISKWSRPESNFIRCYQA